MFFLQINVESFLCYRIFYFAWLYLLSDPWDMVLIYLHDVKWKSHLVK